MNDRSPLKTDNHYSNKRKAEDRPQMNSIEGDSQMDGVNAKKGKTISKEELSELVSEIENCSISGGKKGFMIPIEWWQKVVDANKNGLIDDVPEISTTQLYREGSLRMDLTIGRDYRLVSEEIFYKLKEAFGVTKGHEVPTRLSPKGRNGSAASSDAENATPSQSLTSEELRELVKIAETEKMTLGDKWFVVCKTWWNAVHNASINGYPEDVRPINCDLISQPNGMGWILKPALVESADYIYIPAVVYNRLNSYVGMVNKKRDYIEREVVRKGKNLILQTYPRIFPVSLARDRAKVVNIHLTGDETMTELRQTVLERMGLDRVSLDSLRFYITSAEGPENWEQIDPTQDNIDAYFDTAQKVLIDIRDEEGNWFINNKKTTLTPSSSSSQPLSSIARIRGDLSSPGTCGLQNLGNTCFMASAIQCLSNVPPLTDFFFNDDYINDLNTSNPLGTHGELARAYAELVRQIWSNENTSITPRKLKATIGQFAPRFSGYQQQDSQELLTYLLDALHEDLNRIKNKPYTSEDEDLDKLEEHAAAETAWASYKARNNSIIVDKFHGQLKSRLICPSCHKISIKFDPFCFLSVPVPAGRNIPKLSLTLIYNAVPKKKWAKFTMTLSTGMCNVKDVIACVNENLKQANNSIEGCLFTVGMSSDNVRILGSTECVMGDDFPKNYYIAQLDHKEEDRKYVIVKNHSREGRHLSIPMIFSYMKIADLSNEFITEKVIAFIHATYHVEGTKLTEDAYTVFVDTGDKQYPYPEQLAEPPQGKYVTLIVVWKDQAIFNNYRGDHLIEREVSVQNTRDVHLLDCIDLFTREEQLGEQDSWYCPDCKEHKRATKKLDLWSLPEILIIHLKRFHYGKFTREKIEDPVLIPVRDFELNDKLANEKHEHVKYDLISVSNHMGGLGGGHYTAFARNRNGKWYEFNDSLVSQMYAPTEPWLDRNSYVLVYQRKNILPDAAHTDHNLEMETD